MCNIADIQRAVTQCFGLAPRPAWDRECEKAVAEMSARYGCDRAELLRWVIGEVQMLSELASYLVVAETYFNRHASHFEFLARLGEERLSSAAQFTVWSAGCSTGEEPYSVVICLREALGSVEQVEVIASDLSLPAIEKARRGRFRAWSFRHFPPELTARHFRQEQDTFQINENIRSSVRFECCSMSRHLELFAPGAIDLVLFRNVGIYLEEETLKQAYRAMREVLKQDGVLIVAPSDPRPPRDLFVGINHDSTSIYRAGSVQRARPVPPPTRSITPDLPKKRIEPLPKRPSFEAQSEPVGVGDNTEYVLRGQKSLSCMRCDEAVADFRRAVFLNPTDKIARFWYVQALQTSGSNSAALSQLRALHDQLLDLPISKVLEDEETTTGELLDAVELIRESLE